MPLPVYERRKFVRIETHLQAVLDQRHRVAIRMLSLGGCLIETAQPLRMMQPVRIEFEAFGDGFSLSGQPVNSPAEMQFGVRFDPESNDQAVRLAVILDKIQNAPLPRRPARVRLLKEALLDGKPCLLTSLGEGGCFLRTPESYVRGDIVELRCILDQKPLHLAAQVRWRMAMGIGVQYLSPEPDQILRISEYVARHAKGPPE